MGVHPPSITHPPTPLTHATQGTLSRTFATSLAFVDLECGRISRATFARLFESEVAAVLAAAALGDVNSGDAHTHGKDGTGKTIFPPR